MGTIKRSFQAAQTILSAFTLVGITEKMTSDVNMETAGYMASHAIVDITWDGAGTEDVDINVYGSLDGSNYDDVPFMRQRAEVVAGFTKQYSFLIYDFAHFRFGFKHVSAEANEATITAIEKRWDGVTAS